MILSVSLTDSFSGLFNGLITCCCFDLVKCTTFCILVILGGELNVGEYGFYGGSNSMYYWIPELSSFRGTVCAVE